MVFFYSRFAILFVLNLILIVSVVLHVSGKSAENISVVSKILNKTEIGLLFFGNIFIIYRIKLYFIAAS